jgi:hypothetical protein
MCSILLKLKGHSMSDEGLPKLVAKGPYAAKIYTMSPAEQVEYSQEDFMKVLVEEGRDLPPHVYQGRTNSIMEMLNGRGPELSSGIHKLFSTGGEGKGTSRDTGSLRVGLDDGPTPVKRKRAAEDSEGESVLESLLGNPSRTKTSQVRSSGGLEEAIREQSAQISAAVQLAVGQKKETRHNVVKVSPTIRWPILADGGPDSKDAEEFYDKYEELCSFANDGRGMNPKKHLRTLQSCLRGSEEKIYRLVYKTNRGGLGCSGRRHEGPAIEVQRNSDGEADGIDSGMGSTVERQQDRVPVRGRL